MFSVYIRFYNTGPRHAILYAIYIGPNDATKIGKPNKTDYSIMKTIIVFEHYVCLATNQLLQAVISKTMKRRHIKSKKKF